MIKEMIFEGVTYVAHPAINALCMGCEFEDTPQCQLVAKCYHSTDAVRKNTYYIWKKRIIEGSLI